MHASTSLLLLKLVSASVGFVLAYRIYQAKRRKTRLICPKRTNCTRVVESDYSVFLGIPIEHLGMLYSLFVVATTVVHVIFPAYLSGAPILLFTVSLGGLLFSLYLVSIQAFFIRQWCLWCVGFALSSLGIFTANFFEMRMMHLFSPLSFAGTQSVLVSLVAFALASCLVGAVIAAYSYKKVLHAEAPVRPLRILNEFHFVTVIALITVAKMLFIFDGASFVHSWLCVALATMIAITLTIGYGATASVFPRITHATLRIVPDTGYARRRLRDHALPMLGTLFGAWAGFGYVLFVARELGPRFALAWQAPLFGALAGFVITSAIGAVLGTKNTEGLVQ